MKISIFFTLIIIIFIGWSVYLKPYDISQKDLTNIPEVVFENFSLKGMEKSGIINKISGKKAFKYKEKLEIIDLKYIGNKEPKEELVADKGIYLHNKIFLYNNIIYKTKDLLFLSNKAIYDLKRKILKCRSKFTLFYNKSKVIGRDLIYDKNIGKILAKNIYAIIESEK